MSLRRAIAALTAVLMLATGAGCGDDSEGATTTAAPSTTEAGSRNAFT